MSTYIYLGEGTKGDFESVAEQLVSNDVPEGGYVEVQMEFSHRFDNFYQYASQLDDRLRSDLVGGEWMKPWKGNYQIVYVDPELPIWYIRYIKGHVWIGWIVMAIMAIAVIWAAFVLWRLFRFVPALFEQYPWIAPVAVVGTIGILGVNAIKRPLPAEVVTTYSRAGKARKEETKYK
jgi:hypothetical protein